MTAHAPAHRHESFADKREVLKEVATAFAATRGTPIDQVRADTPISGGAWLSYSQRIRLVSEVEKRFALRIDDEHWQSMTSVGQLADYVSKRKELERLAANPASVRGKPWAQIQQSFPPNEQPTFVK